MDQQLPTYQEAQALVTQDGTTVSGLTILRIVAPYILDEDLLSCCLLSHEGYKIFAPILWHEPTRLLLSGPDGYGKFVFFG